MAKISDTSIWAGGNTEILGVYAVRKTLSTSLILSTFRPHKFSLTEWHGMSVSSRSHAFDHAILRICQSHGTIPSPYSKIIFFPLNFPNYDHKLIGIMQTGQQQKSVFKFNSHFVWSSHSNCSKTKKASITIRTRRQGKRVKWNGS